MKILESHPVASASKSIEDTLNQRKMEGASLGYGVDSKGININEFSKCVITHSSGSNTAIPGLRLTKACILS